MSPSIALTLSPMGRADLRLPEGTTMFEYVANCVFFFRLFCTVRLIAVIQIWKIQGEGDERKPIYLSTLAKHNQAVNVVRFSPRGSTE